MNVYQLKIEYLGLRFSGWQIQKKNKTVQGILQKILSKTLKEKVTIYGSGRTDAGVNAIEQSAHFVTKKKISKKKFLNTANYFLNKYEISLLNILKKTSRFHARYSAKKRIYKYIIINRASPLKLDLNRAWHVKKKLNLFLMRKGAKLLQGTHDFSTYRSSKCGSKSPIKTLEKVNIKKNGEKVIITFISKSFLQQQVRSMVGCLKNLGNEKWSLKKFLYVLKKKDRRNCAPPAPPCGLYLFKVQY